MSRLMAGVLFGVKPADPPTFALVALLLVAVALLACYIPARRASALTLSSRCERVASPSGCPQYAQFDHVGSTGFSHFEHVGCRSVPQRGQYGKGAFSRCPDRKSVV